MGANNIVVERVRVRKQRGKQPRLVAFDTNAGVMSADEMQRLLSLPDGPKVWTRTEEGTLVPVHLYRRSPAMTIITTARSKQDSNVLFKRPSF